MKKLKLVHSEPRGSLTRLFTVTSCTACPNLKKERTRGAGYADDYNCYAVDPPKLVAGYVEWPSELPKPGEFPNWCPLPKGRNES